jgi:hypothetical protein
MAVLFFILSEDMFFNLIAKKVSFVNQHNPWLYYFCVHGNYRSDKFIARALGSVKGVSLTLLESKNKSMKKKSILGIPNFGMTLKELSKY